MPRTRAVLAHEEAGVLPAGRPSPLRSLTLPAARCRV